MEKKQIPRTHAGKKLNPVQEKIIEQIQRIKGYKSLLEAKHEYFENQARYDQGDHLGLLEKNEEATEPAEDKNQEEEIIEYPRRKGPMSIEETKLGVTMVISAEECEKIGINTKLTTKAAIDLLRSKLGLKTKAQMKAERDAA